MNEIAIFSASISVVVMSMYGVQSWRRRSKIDLIFSCFALAMTLHNINLYVWLNLPASDPLVPLLRAMDYFYGLPLLCIGVYFLHISAEARVERPNKWIFRLIIIIFVVSLCVISVLYLILDPEYARRTAVVFGIPLIAVLPIYYINHFRKYPYKTAKPEYERGYRVIVLGYFSMVFGTGIFAGLFRMIDLGIAFEAVSVILVAMGGYIISTITYSGLHEQLEILHLIIDNQGRVLHSNFPEDGTSMNKLALATSSHILEEVEKVMHTGSGLTIPSIKIEPLGPKRRFKIDILPHEIGTDGQPTSAIVALTDITGSMENLESEKISEVLSRYKDEREKASFYLDLLSHDMANIMQGILLGVETVYHQIKRNLSVLDALSLLNEEVDRSMILLRETKVMVQVNEAPPRLRNICLIESIESAIFEIHKLYPNANITFNTRFFSTDDEIAAEEMVKYLFFSVFRFIIDNTVSTRKQLSVIVTTYDSSLSIEVTSDDLLISTSDLDGLFEWQSRIPSGGVGLPLANLLAKRYQGSISIHENVNDDEYTQVCFRIVFPRR